MDAGFTKEAHPAGWFRDMWMWCNGRWQQGGEWSISPADRGLTLGLGFFETILAQDGVPCFLERHLRRIDGACRRLGWPGVGEEFSDGPGTIRELLQREQLGSGRARVRLTVTAGSGPIDDLRSGEDRRILLTAAPAGEWPVSLAVGISRFRRNEASAVAGLKCASYAENAIALAEARQAGWDEAIFLNAAGQVCEAACANVFVVKRGVLMTPALASGCLPGVCRAMVMELAGSLGIECREVELLPEEFAAAEEAFLTSALRGPVGISRTETRTWTGGRIISRLREAWEREVAREIDSACHERP